MDVQVERSAHVASAVIEEEGNQSSQGHISTNSTNSNMPSGEGNLNTTTDSNEDFVNDVRFILGCDD